MRRGNTGLGFVSSVPSYSVILALLVLVVVLPFAVIRTSHVREAALRNAEFKLRLVEARQKESMQGIVELQRLFVAAKSKLVQVAAVLTDEEALVAARESAQLGTGDKLHKDSLALQEEIVSDVAALDKEVHTELRDLREQLDIKKNRFLVKWHGDEGAKTSRRMANEAEALAFFNQVGDFAKKMLMFDGQRWLVLREYGGENWLAMLHDNGDIQDGDGKPPKKKQAK